VYISPCWRLVLVPPIFMKFGVRRQLTDVIMYVKFLVDRFRGYGVLTPPKLPFPNDLLRRPYNSVRTAMRHCDILLYCCLLGPLLCIVSFRCYMFSLLVVLVKLSVLAKWLARKTPPRKPNRGEEIISIKPRRKSAHDLLDLFIASLFYYVFELSPAPTCYIILPLWHDIAYVLKVPLNNNKPTKPQPVNCAVNL